MSTENLHKNRFDALLPWIVWGLGALFYLYQVFLKISPGVMTEQLMLSFSVSAAALSKMLAMYLYIYASMQIVVGMLLDRFGPRKLLIFSSTICALGAYLFGSADTLFMAGLGRFCIGLGSSFALVSTMKLAANWFPENRFALLVGLSIAVGFIGGVIAEAPLAFLVEQVDWRTTLHIIGAAGFILTFLIWLIVRDRPKQISHQPTAIETSDSFSMLEGLKVILSKRQNWFIAIYGALIFAPTEIIPIWGVSFLSKVYGISHTSSAGMISMIFFGYIVGSPMLGNISDRTGRRLPPMLYGNIGALICMLFIVYVHVPQALMYFIIFAFGFCSSGFLAAFSLIKETNPPEYNATALGYFNALNMIMPAFLLPLVGVILDWKWSGEFVKNIPFYSIHDFKFALTTLPICLVLSLIMLMFVRESRNEFSSA